MAAEKTSPRDLAFWLLALLILIGGIIGFYQFQNEVITLVRVIGLLVATGLAVAVAGQTVKGRELLFFFREADVERRKVVWPNRQETMQTTLMVLVVTIIVGIMLFVFDTIFGWIIRRLIGVAGS